MIEASALEVYICSVCTSVHFIMHNSTGEHIVLYDMPNEALPDLIQKLTYMKEALDGTQSDSL